MREELDFSHVEIWKGDAWYANVVCVGGERIEVEIDPWGTIAYFYNDDLSVQFFANTAGDYRVNRCIIADTRKEVSMRIAHHDNLKAA